VSELYCWIIRRIAPRLGHDKAERCGENDNVNQAKRRTTPSPPLKLGQVHNRPVHETAPGNTHFDS
jgi:hypothetical protein